MSSMSRRHLLAGGAASTGALALGSRVAEAQQGWGTYRRGEYGAAYGAADAYGAVYGEPFPIPAAPLSHITPAYLRAQVYHPSSEAPGTILIDPRSRYLYQVLGGGRAMRYGVGVGREGFSWSG